MMQPLSQKVSADVRVPDLGTEGKNARRMSGSVVGPISSRESGETNDITQNLVEIGTQFLQGRVIYQHRSKNSVDLHH